MQLRMFSCNLNFFHANLNILNFVETESQVQVQFSNIEADSTQSLSCAHTSSNSSSSQLRTESRGAPTSLPVLEARYSVQVNQGCSTFWLEMFAI